MATALMFQQPWHQTDEAPEELARRLNTDKRYENAGFRPMTAEQVRYARTRFAADVAAIGAMLNGGKS